MKASYELHLVLVILYEVILIHNIFPRSGAEIKYTYTLIISMLKKLVTSDQLPLDILTVAKLTNQASHVSQY